ncbi:MAG: NAD(P)/FAD-dependent oxidoreductase [Proteobacteria bacterium]|nr:NAD(P)/FAD-dependent oxidoreductase [Pseudomonadota bacterium]
MSRTEAQEFDVLIVGAGFAGMYMLHRMRGLGLSARVIEAGKNVGGTWYWNRYPGARCDIPSMEYSYSFSKELEQEWDWTEVMAGQPEILKYAERVADKFDLRRDIQFNTRVVSAHYDENRRWRITTDSNEVFLTRYCIMATGCLSVPNTPYITGAEDFAGPVYHTGEWPHEGVDFSEVTVGIIGTGSSGIQAIPVIAENAKHLTIFQRTPNYTMPAHNRPLTREFIEKARANYEQIREAQRASQAGIVGYGFGFGGADNTPPTEHILQTTPEQRMSALDEMGFVAIRKFVDIGLDMDANELACDMYREQVRRIVKDEQTAEGLMPRGYPIGCKRPVIDTDYYQAFNRDNVTLVDLRRGGIERITATGIKTAQGDFEFDALVYATGFDAMTGALLGIDIKGREGVSLKSRWEAGPRTYLGLQVAGFPNLFTITGPGSPSVLSNMIVSIEQHVEWITDCIAHMDEHQYRAIEPTPEAEQKWIEHVNQAANGTMLTAPSCNSWYLGANIPGKPRIFMPYVGGVGAYREKCNEVAASGYEGFSLTA